MNIDIVSDLHIDHWDNSLENIYPNGNIKDIPYIFPNKKSDILIIAGDISNDIYMTLDYLNELSKEYKIVLYVDGNHEHTLVYPKLYDHTTIFNLTKKYNDNIYYLPKSNYKINNTVILGLCGWWDYNNEDSQSIIENNNYFDGWINHFKEEESNEFIKNVINKSKEEYKYLEFCLNIYDNDDNIKNIIVVTHTIPIFEYLNNINNSNKKSNGCNSKFKKIIDNNKKISHWIFGHTHEQIEFKYNNIQFICHPRGRPEDYNREKYELKTIII